MDGRSNRGNKAAFLNSSGLKNVFEKLRFRDGLAWTLGLTIEIKLCFQISPVQCGRGLRFLRSVVKAVCDKFK